MSETITQVKLFNTLLHAAANELDTQTAVVSRTPIAGANSYYRSRTFIPLMGINPLIAVAAPLLSLNTKLKYSSGYDDINELYQNLVHEINAFETNVQNQGYRAETLLIARYILCATLDETILTTPWGKASDWQNYQLLSTFQKENSADERFFLILERVSEDPREHIDLLELIYLGLRLGFEGQYREGKENKIKLDAITDTLYQRIRAHRSDPKTFIQLDQAMPDTQLQEQTLSIWSTLWKTSLVTCVFILAVYFCFATLVDEVTTPAKNDFQAFAFTHNKAR